MVIDIEEGKIISVGQLTIGKFMVYYYRVENYIRRP